MAEVLIKSAAMVIVFGLLFYLANNRIKECLELRRKKQSSDEDNQRVELLERKNAAELARATASERIEREKAQLLQETAEARVASKVADDPSVIAARAAEEKQIIEARAEGRAQAAKERAASESSGSNVTATLVDAYKAYLNNGGPATKYTTFDDWLGDLDIDDFR